MFTIVCRRQRARLSVEEEYGAEGARRVFVMAWLRADVRDRVPRDMQGGLVATRERTAENKAGGR